MSIYINGDPASGLPASYPSDRVTYDNTSSGLTSDDVQGAIDELASGGGHVIQNAAGTDMTQRTDLQFVGVYTEDDSMNDRTKVNVVRTMTKAEMDSLSAAEKVGFIRTSDEADNPYVDIDASDVTYGSGTVKDALDATPITVTEASGCTITNLTAYKCGRFTKISGRATFDNAVGSGSNADIGNIPVEFAPQDTVVCVAINKYDLGAVLVNSSGLISFRHIVGSAAWRDNTFTLIY